MEKIKILVVGEPGSIHTARFVSLLQRIGYEVRVFQCEYTCGQDEHLNNTTIYAAFPYVAPINANTIKGYYLFANLFVRLFCSNALMQRIFSIAVVKFFLLKKKTRPKHLVKLIKNWQPDIIFSLKMQNDGYTVSKAREIMGNNFKARWVHFNWGTDIEFFGKHPDYIEEHLPKIKKLLSECDFHIADCKRDAKQAIEYGFKGVSLGDCVAQGGFSLEYIKKIMFESAGHERNFILIKGRQGGYVGKAFNILQALHKTSHLLKGYKVKIFMTTPDVGAVAVFLQQMDGIDFEIIPRIPYRDLLSLYSRSRIAISASDVDGTPGFLLESMAMGALPIHSDMASVREWVVDGENGLLFPVDDISALTSSIEKALTEDSFVEKARELNWSIVKERVDSNKIEARVKSLIEDRIMANEGKVKYEN